MSDDRPYVRVYYSDLIRDYKSVWDDNDQLATWLRMLATADPMWPTRPELTRSMRPRIVEQLTKAELIDVQEDRYTVKGLDEERIRRRDAGRNAAAKRWHSEGIREPDADPMPKRAEPSQDENEPSQEAREPALEAYQRIFTYPSKNALKFLDDLIEGFGQERTARAIGFASQQGRENLLSRTRAVLVLWDREREKREKEAKQREGRAPIHSLKVEPSDLSPSEIDRLAAEYRAANPREAA